MFTLRHLKKTPRCFDHHSDHRSSYVPC